MENSQNGHASSQLGVNAWLVEEMYQAFLVNPEGVDKGWRDYFSASHDAAQTNGHVAIAAPAPSSEG